MDKAIDFALAALALTALALAGLMAVVPAWAQAVPDAAEEPAWSQEVRALALDASRTGLPGARVEVEVGRLDARLKLAPCVHIQPYLPPGTRPWGKTRIGLRCLQGPTAWNVYLPVTVKVFAPALVAVQPLAAGSVLTAADLQEAEVDLAAGPTPAVSHPPLALGRVLARPLAPGQSLRTGDLRPRQWFAAGDTVRIVAAGAGYAVSGEGQALAAGLEGQAVRVRTEGGRVVTGTAVAERQVEMTL